MPYFSLPNVVFVSESPELNGEGDACLTDYVATRWYREVNPHRAKLFPNHKYWVTQKLPQIYTENHATFPIKVSKITVQIYGNFWFTQYIK